MNEPIDLVVSVTNPDNVQLSNYVWTVTPAGGGAALPVTVDQATGKGTVTPTAPGTYLANVTLNWQTPDGQQRGTLTSQWLRFAVNERAPTIASASAVPNPGQVNQPVALTVTLTNPDNAIIDGYAWVLTSVPQGGSTPVVTVDQASGTGTLTPTVAGAYQASLAVTWHGASQPGGTLVVRVPFSVIAAPTVTSVTATPTSVELGQSVALGVPVSNPDNVPLTH